MATIRLTVVTPTGKPFEGDVERVIVRSTSGDATLNSVIASGKIKIKSTSGDIRLDGCDANEFDVRSTSGDIEGTLKSDKVFNVHTTSGDINVPSSVEGSGTFSADVTSGDVKISIEK